MAKKPARTWTLVLSLGIPLAIVGGVAMAISYATLIDVARVNGLPLPELFPILIDVGTVATMIAASQYRIRGISGSWLAYAAFMLLSAVSIVANATHAGRAADMTLTTPWAAAVLASTPPAALLAITHIVMKLIPDEKERAKLQAQRERNEQATVRRSEVVPSAMVAPVTVAQPAHADVAQESDESVPTSSPLRLVDRAEDPMSEESVRSLVVEYIAENENRPTGKLVGEWLGGKSPKTGQRFIKSMEDDGYFEPTQPAEAALAGV